MHRKSHEPNKAIIAGMVFAAGFMCFGCGDYSRDDIIFAAAVPSAEDVALRPPGVDASSLSSTASSTRQALEGCEKKRLRCQAQDVANMFNTLTSGLLAHIDAILAHRPSARKKNGRVWGPYFLEDKGVSLRFEMERIAENEFSHCLHFSAQEVSNSDMWGRNFDCSILEDERTGFVRVLSGTFSPGRVAGETAESGAGTLLFDADRLAELNEGEKFGVFEIVYDNFSEVQTISIDFEKDSGNPSGSGADPISGTYEYTRRLDTSGTFYFSVWDDFSEEGQGLFEPEQEKLIIAVQWNSDQAGRGDATVQKGNLGSEEWTVLECWNADLDTTYFLDEDPEHEDIGTSIEEDCVFQEAGTTG